MIATNINTSKAITATGPTVPLNLPLAAAVGVCGALLLKQIEYWCGMKSNYKRGHYWVYRSYAGWAAELGIYTEKTIQRTISTLKEQGLIVVANDLNRNAYDKTTWYRLDVLKVLSVIEKAASGWTECPSGGGHNVQTGVDKMSEPIPETTKETTKENTNTAGISFPLNTSLKTQDTTSGIQGDIKKNSVVVKTANTANTGDSMKAEDVLKTLKTQTPITHPVMLWKKRMAVLQEGYQNLTKVEEAQLRQVAKKMGTDWLPVMDYALQNWNTFSLQAKKDKGAFGHLVPTPGFLLKFWESAVVCYQQNQAYVASKQVDTCNQLQKPTPVKPVVTVSVDNEPKMTLEEIYADIGYLLKKG